MSNNNVDITKEELLEQINNKTYFAEARSWYALLFLEPHTHRVYQLLLFLLILFSAGIMVIILNTEYIRTQVPFAIYFDEQLEYFPRIQAISKADEPINISYARYFAKYYTELREGYNLEEQENKNILLKAISSLRTYDNYLSFIDPNQNPDSPVLRYKAHTTRSIEVIDVQFLPDVTIPDQATVTFRAIETSNNSRNRTTESFWRADISFAMTDINNVLSKDVTPRFTVTKYQVHPM